ncbi:hypothetical protein BH10PSE16_BH10PSE16_43780 [soil metagenome]
MTNELIMFGLTQIATAAGIYAAIRGDLREHQVRIAMLEEHNKRRSCN